MQCAASCVKKATCKVKVHSLERCRFAAALACLPYYNNVWTLSVMLAMKNGL